jgi:hypothetical protein
MPEGYDGSSQVGLEREVMRGHPEKWQAILRLQETMDKRSLRPRVAPQLMAGRFLFFKWV